MASLRIFEDQENRRKLPDLRQKQTINLSSMATTNLQKRPAFGTIDTNKEITNNGKGRVPFAETSRACNNTNIRKNESHRGLNLVAPVVPVAQFEAFNVYEDDDIKLQEERQRINQKMNKEERVQITKPEIVQNEHCQDNDNGRNNEPQIVPMSTEKCTDENRIVTTISPKSSKDVFFEMPEYRQDIYEYLREHELRHRPKPGYILKQPDVSESMRAILVDWLVEVAEEYRMHTETLYLAVNFIDRFLSYMSVVRAKLQLVGTAAMFIAAKYEEIFPPDVGEFVYITDDTYDKSQVIRMEALILRVLGFDLSIPTPLTFITAISSIVNLSDKTRYLATYMCELTILEVERYLQFLPSTLAAAAIALARHTLGDDVWNDDLQKSTGYSLKQLQQPIAFVLDMFVKAPTNPQHAIHDKYKSTKYLQVSKLTPNSEPIIFE